MPDGVDLDELERLLDNAKRAHRYAGEVLDDRGNRTGAECSAALADDRDASRELREALVTAAPALIASARDLAALLDALPHCRWKAPELDQYGQRVLCDRLATCGTLSHEPEWCDEHAASHVRDCDWADIIRRRDGR